MRNVSRAGPFHLLILTWCLVVLLSFSFVFAFSSLFDSDLEDILLHLILDSSHLLCFPTLQLCDTNEYLD